MASQANPMMAAGVSPFQDPAEPILTGDPSLTDDQRAALWDTFHGSKDPSELAQKLQVLAVPTDTKHRLWEAKQATVPAPSQVEKVAAALQKLHTLDPETLATAEKYPTVSKAFIDAAVKPPEKPAGAGAGASKTPGKGNTAKTTMAPVPAAPRPDGMPHLPAIPEGMKRVLASNGSLHDIPEDRIEEARTRDPLLHVLNP